MLVIANSRYDWQHYMRGIARGMIDLLMGYMANGCIHTRIAAVEVAIVAREVTAGYFDPNPVTCLEDITCLPEPNLIFVNGTWVNQRWRFV